MNLVDVNLLIYAYNTGSPFHAVATAWLDDELTSGGPLGIPWVCILAFLRLTTNRRVFPEPLTIDEATDIVHELMRHPSTRVIVPGSGHWEILRSLLLQTHASGAHVTDVHIAALAIEQDATICTSDRDFARFKGIRILNPLDRSR